MYHGKEQKRANEAFYKAAEKAGFAKVLQFWQVEVYVGYGQAFVAWDPNGEVREGHEGHEGKLMPMGEAPARASAWLKAYAAKHLPGVAVVR
jgi:hypothetical protein